MYQYGERALNIRVTVVCWSNIVSFRKYYYQESGVLKNLWDLVRTFNNTVIVVIKLSYFAQINSSFYFPRPSFLSFESLDNFLDLTLYRESFKGSDYTTDMIFLLKGK